MLTAPKVEESRFCRIHTCCSRSNISVQPDPLRAFPAPPLPVGDEMQNNHGGHHGVSLELESLGDWHFCQPAELAGKMKKC